MMKKKEASKKKKLKKKIRKGSQEELPKDVYLKEKEKIFSEWTPKTELGKDVVSGKYSNIDEILESGLKIMEPAIVDALVPNLSYEIIYIGGSPGKGGGIKRTITKKTARMHKSGRRFRISALAVVGNFNGIVGVGEGKGNEHSSTIEKAIKNAKLNIIKVRRGCGSWECNCGTEHSLVAKTQGKCSSVNVSLIPAPRGLGLASDAETKKLLRLAGIKDIWCRTMGRTSARANLIKAVFEGLRNLSKMKLAEKVTR